MWTDQTAKTFIDYGRYFVPYRELQMQIICDLIPSVEEPYQIIELACGEGLLAEVLLEKHDKATVHGLDASPLMLSQAEKRLNRFGERFKARKFDMFDDSWRTEFQATQAVVSSLAIHHLDEQQKLDLFKDIHEMLRSGGAFINADVIQPANDIAVSVAADAWDEAVKRRALELDGDDSAFDYFQREHWNMFRYSDPIDKPSSIFEQLRWLDEAGFAGVDIYWMAAGHAIFGGIKPAR